MNCISISFSITIFVITIFFIYKKIKTRESYKLLNNIGDSPITNIRRPFGFDSAKQDISVKYTDNRYVRNDRKRN